MPSEKAVLYDPNRRAAASLRDRVRARREVFDAMLPEMKARAFTAAGMEDMAALARVQEAVAKIPEGGDWKSARKQIAAELVGAWDEQAKKAKVDPDTLAATAKRRAETILQVNVSQARSVSRPQARRREDRPRRHRRRHPGPDRSPQQGHRSLQRRPRRPQTAEASRVWRDIQRERLCGSRVEE